MFCKRTFRPSQNFYLYILSASWIVGVICGGCLADSSLLSGISMMRVFTEDVSIVRYLLALFIPYTLTFTAIVISAKYLICCLSFLKAFTYSFCVFYILKSFEGFGWLVKLLFLFSDGISVVVLLFVWIRVLTNDINRGDIALTIPLMAAICFVDIYLVIPYMASLFNQ